MPSRNQEPSSISNISAVVLAVWHLGGEKHLVDLEDIAVKSDSITAGRFRWKKYSQHINIYTVRLAVKDAQTQNLLRGDATRGWQLTPEGLAQISSLEKASKKKRPEVLGRDLQRRREMERVRIVESSAYQQYMAGTVITKRDAMSVFRLDDYSGAESISRAIDRAQMLFAQDQLKPFIDAMIQRITDQGQ